MTERATFLATIPDILSAIKLGRDGARIQLDIPEIEMGNALDILAWRNCVLRVTIEPTEVWDG